MNETQLKFNELSGKILEALIFLDLKGTNENVTQAMTIVYEGFLRQEAGVPFSANDLFLEALAHKTPE